MPIYPSIEVDANEHALRIELAVKISNQLELAIAAKAYTDALDLQFGIAVVPSTVRNETHSLLQKFISGQAQLSESTQALEEMLVVAKQDARIHAKYAKRMRFWTRLFEIVFGKNNLKTAAKASKETTSQIDPTLVLIGISLAICAIWLARVF